MSKIQLHYAGNDASIEVPYGTTVDAFLSNPNNKAVFGFGDNLQARIDGAVVDGSTVLADDDELVIETRANQKA